MSRPSAEGCPNWGQLAAARDASPADPPGWDQALRHLDECPRCRPEAMAADPLLAFRRLPPLLVAEDEAERMRLRVAALRGAGRLTPSRRWPALRQAAAAAVLALGLLAGGGAPQRPGADSPPGGMAYATAPALDAALSSEPLFEELDQRFDQVVQWNGDNLSVVLVVDGRLGV
jgi:hypothetical protein